MSGRTTGQPPSDPRRAGRAPERSTRADGSHHDTPAGRATATEELPLTVLVVLAAAVFIAITTEVLPVGLLPVISTGLRTSESRVGLLVSAYAVVVALGSIPRAAAKSAGKPVTCAPVVM